MTYSDILGQDPLEWMTAPIQPQGEPEYKQPKSAMPSEAEIYANWVKQGFINDPASGLMPSKAAGPQRADPSLAWLDSNAYPDWFKEQVRTGTENVALTDYAQFERSRGEGRTSYLPPGSTRATSKLAPEIPTVTNAKFANPASLVDSITNAGWVVIKTDQGQDSAGQAQIKFTVGKYDPSIAGFTDFTVFNATKPKGSGDLYTGQAFDALLGQGAKLAGSTETNGIPSGPQADYRSSDSILPTVPKLPSSMTRSGYRALNTDQRNQLHDAVTANKMDWNEYLSGLKDPAPRVVAYDELRLMNAQDKGTLRQQVEDAGLNWSDYVDQIYEPWKSMQTTTPGFSNARRVTYATARG